MLFEQRKQRAIAIMESKKMWRSNYAPPLLLLAWKIGIKIPPLPFASFWQITIFTGVCFGSVWGLLMWFFTWKDMDMPSAVAIVSPCLCWLFFWRCNGGVSPLEEGSQQSTGLG